MRVISENEILASAIHEAGHAVAAFVLGRNVPDLSLHGGEEAEGSCGYALWGDVPASQPGAEAIRAWLDDELLVCLAGPVAEELFSGAFDEDLGESDLLLALELAESAADAPEAVERTWDEAEARAEALLRESWDAVRLLAETLVREKYLDAGRIALLLKEELRAEG